MCTLIEALCPYRHLGYTFNSKHTLHLLQYADDTCLISDGPASCQELINHVEEWLQWTGMQAKPAKCHSLAIKASSGSSSDPALKVSGQSIPVINNQAIKFLGKVIQVPLNTNNMNCQILKKLKRMLERVDKSKVTRQQKLRLYGVEICPRLAWDLIINTLPISWVRRKLEATATQFLKKWSGLAKCADTARLYLPQAQGGLSPPSISLLYQKQQVSQSCQLLASRDPGVRYTSKLETKLQRPTHQPMLTARDALAVEPGMMKRALIKKAKSIVYKEDPSERLEHASTLT